MKTQLNPLDEATRVGEDKVESGTTALEVCAELRGWLSSNSTNIAVIIGMGGMSGITNVEHGLWAVTTAGAKQCAYSTVSLFVLLNFQHALARRVETLAGELSPMFIPALLTILANYGVHSLRGTAEPLLSTMPTAVLATLGLPILHIRDRIHELWKDIEDIEIHL